MKHKEDNLSQLYEVNWKWMEGLQMSPEAARLGYDIVANLPKGRVLDIGCGDGTNALELKKLGFQVEGCEISLNAVKKAKQKRIKAKQVDVNTDKLPYKNNSFDLVWLTDVIEHVFWPETLIAEIYRVLKKGGYLYITTPNVIWWGIRLQILFGQTLKNIHPEHIHWFNRRTLLELLKKNNLKVKKEIGYNCYIPHPISYKFPILQRINRIGNSNNLFTYTLVTLARK